MALQMGEVEVKIKANIDDAKSTLQELEGADVEINATVNVNDSELSEILDGAHEVKITAVNDTGDGVEEANSALETVEDKQSDITAEDSTAEGVDAANTSLDNVEDEQADITAEDSTAEGVDAANASLDNVEDEQADITAEDSTAEGVDAANASLETVDDTSAAITATDDTAEAVDSATTALSSVEDEDVDITATDNTGGVIDGIESNLDAIEDESLTITAEDETGDTISTIESNLSAIEDEGVTITAEDNTGSTIEAIETNLSSIKDEGVTITAEDNTEGTIETIETNLSSMEDEGVTITAEDNTEGTIEAIVTNLSSIEDEEVTITAEDNTGSTIEAISSNLSAIEDEGVTITAEDNTEGTIETISSNLSAIEDEEVTITAEADTAQAESDIAEVEDADYSATVEADANTESAEEKLGSLDGEATVTAEANTTGAEVDLNSLEGTAKIKADTTALTENIQSILSKGWEITVKVADIIGDIVSFGAKLGKSIWDGVLSNATEYDDNATAAAIMGVSLKDYMMMKWMADQIDTDPETIMAAARTVKSDLESFLLTDYEFIPGVSYYEGLSEENTKKKRNWKLSEQYKALGREYETANEAFTALGTKGIMDAYVKYIANKDESQQEQLTLQLFGSRGAYLTPWINAARNGTYNAYVKKYGDPTSIYGAAVDDDTSGKLGALADAKADFLSCIDALTTFVSALAAPGMTAIFETLTSTIEEIYKIFNSDATDEEKGQQIAETIKTNLGNLWGQLEEWANSLATILSPILDVIGAFFDSVINKIKQKIGYNDITRYDIFEAGKNEDVLPGFAEISKQYTKTGKYSYTDAQKNLWADNLSKLAYDTYGYELNSEGRQALIDIMSTTAPNLLIGTLEKFDWEDYLDYYGLDKKTNTDGTTTGETTPETPAVSDLVAPISDSTAAVAAATSECANAASTLASTELKAGDVDVTVNNEIHTTGTVETVNNTTEVKKHRALKSSGKSFSAALNGQGSSGGSSRM